MSMSKQSTNKKTAKLPYEPNITTSNKFEALSSRQQQNTKIKKNQSDLTPKPGFDHPNWRHPVNKAQKLYTKTPRDGSNQVERPKVAIPRSVRYFKLSHCNSRTPINSHWKLPNSTYEKQAYLQWSKENSVAFKRGLPQIPYDPWQYIHRIQAEIRKEEKLQLSRDTWAFFQKTRRDWKSQNPNSD